MNKKAANNPMPKRHLKQFAFRPGQSGNPNGRPKGSRNRIAELLLDDLCTAWAEHGRDAIARMLNQRPGDFVKVVASLVPRELLVGETSTLASLSDHDLETLIGSVRALQAQWSQPTKPH
jgi:hypothetical protein